MNSKMNSIPLPYSDYGFSFNCNENAIITGINIIINVGVINIESNRPWIIILINSVSNLKNRILIINNCK